MHHLHFFANVIFDHAHFYQLNATQDDASEDRVTEGHSGACTGGQQSAGHKSGHDRVYKVFFVAQMDEAALARGKQACPQGKGAPQHGRTFLHQHDSE